MSSRRRNVGLVKLVATAGAIALMVLLAGTREMSAGGPLDLTGVACLDLYLDVDPPQDKGTSHGQEDLLVGKILSRIESSAAQPGGWDVTSVAYTGPDLDQNLIPDKPPSAESCNWKEDGNELNSSVAFQAVDVTLRPTATGTLVTKGQDQNLEYSVCQFEEDLLGGRWVLNEFAIVVDGDPQTRDFGILTAYLDPGSCTTGAGLVFNTVIESTSRTATKGEPDPVLPDDWDADGCTDWDELDPDGLSRRGRDPFNPIDCGVGGIAELPEVAQTPIEASDSSEWGAGFAIVIASAVAAAAVALGGAAWYALRGWLR